jgi:hypothetical protein
MSITSRFIKAFDPANERHIKWFAHMVDLAESLSPEKAVTLVAEINMNPLNIDLDHREALDWPHIHFCLCAVYSKAVLRGLAFIPPPKK